jgi:hypothetical protein
MLSFENSTDVFVVKLKRPDSLWNQAVLSSKDILFPKWSETFALDKWSRIADYRFADFPIFPCGCKGGGSCSP